MFKKILVGYDGSEGASIALKKAIEISKFFGAELFILAVGRIPEYAQTISEVEETKEIASKYYGKILNEAEELARKEGIPAKTLLKFGKPEEIIVSTADELKVDLIVLGPSRYSYLRRRILGSTAEKVVEHASCSVLIAK
ncbi:MAG: universal stress protein [Archaeoglobales archaeon]|nr:universal stress protein [Archaeoglobales archaeon]